MALSGMTGFARIEGGSGDWTWAVEARSVNGRNLEVRFKAPSGFDGLEQAVREATQARFRRGQLGLTLHLRRADTASTVRVNTAELEALIAASRPYVERGEAAAPRFDGLLAIRGVLEVAEQEDSPEARAAAEQAMAADLGGVLDSLHTARLQEGAALAPVLDGLVGQIALICTRAEAEAGDIPRMLKARLQERMAELLGDASIPQERIAQEAAALAVKGDVREELDRLSAHVASARELLAGDEAVGRRLDFLSQEFMREANTLCSKSATTALTALGLELKALIEQFREQVQNVE